MYAEVGEVSWRGPCGTPGASWNEDHGPIRYGMYSTVNVDRTSAGHADDEYVYLVVDVLPNPVTRLEAHQVGVQLAAPLEGPDRSCPPAGRRGDLTEVYGTIVHAV
jgi:hypothetical protein